MNHILSQEAANESVRKYFRDEMSELMDCLDLSYHHHLTNIVKTYNSSSELMITKIKENIQGMTTACSNLNARDDKQHFLDSQAGLFAEPEHFNFEFHNQFQSEPEVCF